MKKARTSFHRLDLVAEKEEYHGGEEEQESGEENLLVVGENK